MDADDFHIMFQALVTAPNGVLMMKKIEPLESLERASRDLSCRKASDALYATCRDVPWLRFLLEPEQIWLQRALPIGLFLFGTYKQVRIELDGRSKKPVQDPEQKKAQPEPAPGPDPAEDKPGRDQGIEELKVEVSK